MVWNTRNRTIANWLEMPLGVQDGEDPGIAITVPSKGKSDFLIDVAMPWCNSHDEIKKKAYQVRNLQTGKLFLYLFQNYQTDSISWSLADSGNLWTSQNSIRNGSLSNDALTPQEKLDLYILPDKVFGVPASTLPTDFDTITKIIGTVVATAGAIAAAAL
jgi:hypothetical protein